MDIVERLRSWHKDIVCGAADEAADEIERLRGFMSRLATALEHNKFHGTAEMIRDNIGK